MYKLLILSLGLVGCQQQTQHYSLGVDGFTPEQTELIAQAADKWVAMVNDKSSLTINVYTGNCDPVNDGDTCILPNKYMTPYMASHLTNSAELGVTAQDLNASEDKFPIIYVDTDKIGSDMGLFEHVCEHEIGHMLGLQHTGKGTVMYYTAQLKEMQTDAAQNVTCSDVQQYITVHGVNNECKE